MRRLLFFGALTICTLLCSVGVSLADCSLAKESTFHHEEIGNIQIYRDPSTNALVFTSQMQVNTDGAPDSYHPDDIGITHICNGLSVGENCKWKANCLPEFRKARAENFVGPTRICFFGMATDKKGGPIIQGPDDPKPGYYVSVTAFNQPGLNPVTPQAQLDSNVINYAVIPRGWNKDSRLGVKLGDLGVAYRKSNGKLAYFIVGDLGPNNKLGEGSVALHKTLGNDPFVVKSGKTRAAKGIGGRDVVYILFPGSGSRSRPVDNLYIEAEGEKLFSAFGGKERIVKCD